MNYEDILGRFQDRRLEVRVRCLLKELDSLASDIVTNREVDKFFYMQKLTEIRVLDKKLLEIVDRLCLMIDARVAVRQDLWHHWKRDARWLSAYQRAVRGRVTFPTRG